MSQGLDSLFAADADTELAADTGVSPGLKKGKDMSAGFGGKDGEEDMRPGDGMADR